MADFSKQGTVAGVGGSHLSTHFFIICQWLVLVILQSVLVLCSYVYMFCPATSALRKSTHSVVYSDVYNAQLCTSIVVLEWRATYKKVCRTVLFYLQWIFALDWRAPICWWLAMCAVFSFVRKYCLRVESYNLSVCIVYSWCDWWFLHCTVVYTSAVVLKWRAKTYGCD